MIAFDVRRLLVLMREFVEIESRCRQEVEKIKQPIPLLQPDKSKLKSSLAEIQKLTAELGLDAAVAEAKEFITSLDSQGLALPYCCEVAQRLERLRRNVENQLDGKLFMFVPPSVARMLSEKALFGAEVSKKFPQAIEDIEEAGKCLAMCRYTAGVFHLMRVMEVGVRRLAKRLKVAVDVRDSWGDILRNLHAPIQAMPQSTAKNKAKRDSFLGIEGMLYAVKEAWRNNTMHPKATYTEEEATEIYNSVRTFMRRLAEMV
jgi:hypothetical protein